MMTETGKSRLIWFVLLVLLLLFLMLVASSAATFRRKPSAFTQNTQGSGAAALIAQKPMTAPLPKLVVPPVQGPTVWYFSVTCTDINGVDSAYSNLVSLTNAKAAKLIWDASPSVGITNYTVCWGASETNLYIKSYVGTNLSYVWPPTNRIVLVTSTGCTNLQYAISVRGPWIRLNSTNLLATNVPIPMFWRGMCSKAQGRLSITNWVQ